MPTTYRGYKTLAAAKAAAAVIRRRGYKATVWKDNDDEYSIIVEDSE